MENNERIIRDIESAHEKLKLNLQYSIDRCEENFKVLFPPPPLIPFILLKLIN